jgi:Cof subfamily protein (haloacid dehalogenase superfamily)
MKYKLIVSDLDGTLLDSERKISLRTKDLIHEFASRGGIFTFATGRMEASVEKYLDCLDISNPVIIYNGAKIVDVKKRLVLYEDLLEYSLAKTALMIASGYEWDILLYINKNIYVSKMTKVIEENMIKDGVCCEVVGNLHEFLQCSPTKILIIGDPLHFIPYVEKVISAAKKTVNYVISEYNYLEILPVNSSKGNALKKLAETLDIPLDQTIAVGDNLNDISMIKAAGLGVAVENAHEEVKKNADYITRSNNEDGVAEVIFRTISKET